MPPPLLAFHSEAVAQLLAEDALLVLARGLGLHLLASAFMRLFCTTRSSLLVIGATDRDQQALIDLLSFESLVVAPKVITADTPSADRPGLYRGGGVIFITSRILVVDLLARRVPEDAVAGVFVLNAERVNESSSEAFILRLFCSQLKNGFVKAITDSPETLSGGFMRLEQVMRCLHVRRLLLYPRVHASVKASLVRRPEVVEIRTELSPLMRRIQDAIVRMMDACLQQLRATTKIDAHDLRVEDALFKSFDLAIRAQLQPVWHRVSRAAKQTINDLRNLRKLLSHLVRYDAVTFLTYLESLRCTDGELGEVWLMTDEANTVFEVRPPAPPPGPLPARLPA